MIGKLYALWRHRNTPVGELAEINRLLVKAGRRCAYDLAHAASSIRTDEPFVGSLTAGQFYHDRSKMWEDVFNPADDGKNYRDRLHMEIWNLEMKVERLEKLCKEHGIETSDKDELPF